MLLIIQFIRSHSSRDFNNAKVHNKFGVTKFFYQTYEYELGTMVISLFCPVDTSSQLLVIMHSFPLIALQKGCACVENTAQNETRN